MRKLCELTGREPATLTVGFRSQKLDMTVHLNVSKETYLLVHRHGGIDSYLRQTPASKLTRKAVRLRWDIIAKNHFRGAKSAS
jgi:hypothetical protein